MKTHWHHFLDWLHPERNTAYIMVCILIAIIGGLLIALFGAVTWVTWLVSS